MASALLRAVVLERRLARIARRPAARALIGLFRSGLVTALEQPGRELVFVTAIEVRPGPGESAFLLLEVNPLLYTFGLALFAALMLAARAKAWNLPHPVRVRQARTRAASCGIEKGLVR